jgi:hypothetical protein
MDAEPRVGAGMENKTSFANGDETVASFSSAS